MNSPKTSFNIAEVSELTGIKPYVLRYWETEFPQLSPEKNRSGQRIYRQKDVDVILHVKKLLYEDQYTLAGARQRLQEDIKESKKNQLTLELNLHEAELAGQLMRVKKKIKSLIEWLERPLEGEEEV